MKSTILFIGAGYTTICAYNKICNSSEMVNKIKEGELELIIICDRKHHYFHGFTGDVIGGLIPEQAIYTPLKTIVPLANLIIGSVNVVSPYLKSVKYTGNDGQSKEIKYDQLVIGCGTVDKEEKNPENEHNTFTIKKQKGLTQFRKQLDTVLNNYKRQNEENSNFEKEHIVLCGTGFTSIEMATNMQEYISNTYGDIVNITIVNTGDKILKEWQGKQSLLVKYTEKILRKKDIQILHHCSIQKTTSEGVILSNGEFLKSQLIINATGQIPVQLQGLKHLTMNPENKIETNSFLNASGYTNIWSGGDIALVKKPFSKSNCPSNALWAIMQGSSIGKNIKRTIRNKKPHTFKFPGLGQTASYGKGKAALELYGIPFWGWTAYIIRLGFLFYFFPSKRRLLNICWQSFKQNKGWNILFENQQNFEPEYRTYFEQIKTN